MATTNLTLYSIEAEILNLMIVREALVENDEDLSNAEQKDAIAKVDIQIREKLSSDLRMHKIDGVAYYLREFAARSEAAAEEYARIKDRQRMWGSRLERFQKYVKDVMQLTGQTRLEGNANTLKLVKNPPSVEIAQPELVPDEMEEVTIRMPRNAWKELCKVALSANAGVRIDGIAKVTSAPMKFKIAEALKRGAGVPGCVLRSDVLRLEVE